MEEHNLYVDGGARGNPGPAGCGVVIKSPKSQTIFKAGYYIGRATNNVAEYTALLRGLEQSHALGVRRLRIHSDSELMVKQLTGQYRVKNVRLAELFEQAQQKLSRFDHWQIQHIPREKNSLADGLANQAMDAKVDIAPGTVDTPNVEPSTVKVQARVIKAPSPGICPGKLALEQCFEFSHVLPAGLCIAAASALIPAVTKLQSDPNHAVLPLLVKCSDQTCQASFELTLIS